MCRIWDTFMFRDELDMLEARLTELEDSPVYRHVLVEGTTTHTGIPKPLYYAENQERFAPWADRIIHIIADVSNEPHPWALEHAQRNHVWKAIGDADPDDVVILGDVDEIPSPQAVAAEPAPAIAFDMRWCIFAVDWERPAGQRCSVSARLGYLRGCPDLSAVRDTRSSLQAVTPGGFHLNWLGGVEGIRQKLTATCHAGELPRDLLASGRCYTEGIDYTGEGRLTPVDIDATWPKYIWERRCPENWFRPRP